MRYSSATLVFSFAASGTIAQLPGKLTMSRPSVTIVPLSARRSTFRAESIQCISYLPYALQCNIDPRFGRRQILTKQ